MTETTIADAPQRRRALDTRRSFIVQAPAGSGKTELLIQRYLELLAEVDRPEEILAITFTRKAAAEMRARILRALHRAQAGDNATSAHERITLRAAARALARDHDRAWRLTEFPERMQIQTLDAFNARLASALPVSSGLGGRMRMVGEDGERGIYREAARATLDWLSETGEIGSAVRDLFRHLDNDVSAWERSLAAMLERRDQWLEITGAGPSGQEDRLRRHFEQTIEMLIGDRLRALDRCIPAWAHEPLLEVGRFAADNLGDADPQSPITALRHCTVWPPPTAGTLETWQGLGAMLLTASGAFRRRLDRRQGFPRGSDAQKAAFAALVRRLGAEPRVKEELAACLRLPPPHYDAEQWRALLALLHVLPRATAELKTRFAARGLADYVEVALAAREALGGPGEPTDLALALDYRIRHLLIDEMQDTSLGQYALLESLTAGWDGEDGRTVFCVGDPMQSIYRFRQAEVGLFLALRARGIGNLRPEELVLETNFRSGGRLVDWTNRTFCRVLPENDDLAVGAIRHSPSRAAPGHEGKGRCQIHALADASPAEEAERVRRLLRAALTDPDSGEIAVLVRSRTHLRDLLPLLRTDGIAYRALEIDRLTDLPEVQDLLALTRALIHPMDRVAWLGLLRAPWCGVSLAGLHALTLNDTASPVADLMAEQSRLQRLDPEERRRVRWLGSIMREATREPGLLTLRERVEIVWYRLGGPTLLRSPAETVNAYRFLDIVEALEEGATLADVATLEAQLDEERVSSHGAAECRLSIMTIHRAKGLEFDTVVLMGLGRRPRGTDRPILNWLTLPDLEGHEHLLPSPIGARGDKENDPLHEFIQGVEKEKERYELDRLLYVACTRARKTLHLVANVATRDDELVPPAEGTLLARLWPALADVFGETIESADRKPDGRHRAELVDPQTRRTHDLFRPGELPPVAEPRALYVDSAAAADRIEYAWVGQELRHVGTVVHAWLQRMVDWPDAGTALERLPQLRDQHGALLRSAGVAADRLPEAIERVEQALAGTLEEETGRWILFGAHRHGDTELAIDGIRDRRLQRVVIDRCFVDAAGRHWVVDYKTSRHEGGDPEHFFAEEARRYAGQMQAYREFYAVVFGEMPASALYYPLHGRLVAMDSRAEAAVRDGLPD